ncbi:MAG: hypothetical protein PHP64_04090, partial [Actinomycetota bacterium]|nr:hypothetical protein [Actinomycetota bacterium]
LAGFGARALLVRFKMRGERAKFVASFLISILLILDVMTVPLPVFREKVGDEVPRVYGWLSKQKGKAASVELPLPSNYSKWLDLESQRTYYSVFHWKKIVNGYSSFTPDYYKEVLRLYQSNEFDRLLLKLKESGVSFLVVELGTGGQKFRTWLQKTEFSGKKLKRVSTFESHAVFRIEGGQVLQ